MAADGFAAAFEAAREQLAPPPSATTQAEPFRCLGHDRGRFFFYTTEGRQVLTLSAKDLTSNGELMKLAPLRWLEGTFPGRESFNARAAADELMRACYRAGVYDPDRLRGRGVWLDAGRVVLHLGDRLVVDGQSVPLAGFRSDFIYEQARPLSVDLAEAMSDDDGRALLALCCEVAWENPDRDGRLLAGWIVLSLVCGALAWRPHLWLVSEAGGGKTWVLDNVIRPMLRGLALRVQSKTSEAGIRGKLGSDALPVIFDEAETQNEADRARIQQVLDLARQASSEDGGAITKGTREGGSRDYHIRSSFAFASVNLGLSQAADESRTLVLSIGAGSPEQFAELKRRHAEVFTPGVAARLLARCLRLLPVIRHNADLLADAIARTGAGRRAGDTLGSVMAGALSLTTDRQLTPEEADRIVAEREWVQQAAAEAKPEPEWKRALARLVQAEARWVNANGRPEIGTVGELIGVCQGFDIGSVTYSDADQTLRRMGMRVMEQRLWLGNRSEALGRVFAGSPWANAWLATLSRTPGAERGRAVRFSPAYHDRALGLPLDAIMGDRGA